jgi:Alpha 1,4-glycosyltransferase conserved region
MAQFRSFWYRGSLSPYEHLCLKSFIAKGHDFTLYSYDEIEVPKGVKLENASSIFSEKDVFFHKLGPEAGSVSPFSNWFRYKLLSDFGEWWTDTDVLCLSEEVPRGEICFAYQDGLHINGAILKIPTGHSFSKTLLREAYALGKSPDWGQCGPILVTRVVKELSLDRFAVPTSRFYPIHFSHALDVLLPNLRDEVKLAVRGSCFLHLWNEILRRAPVLKHVKPPHGSYLWEKFSEHDIEFTGAAQYSEFQMQRVVESFGLRERDQEIISLNQIVKQQAQEISAMRSSTSWRLTSPMRFVRQVATVVGGFLRGHDRSRVNDLFE